MCQNRKNKERLRKERQRLKAKEAAINNGTYHGFVKRERMLSEREVQSAIERSTIHVPLSVVMQDFMD